MQRFVLELPTDLDRTALPMLTQDANGTVYLVVQPPDELKLSLLGTLFLTSYVMGMIVRYQPSLWFALIGRSKGDFMLPVLQHAVAVIEDRVPSLVLRRLQLATRATPGIEEQEEAPTEAPEDPGRP
jgi:hypothetical protein